MPLLEALDCFSAEVCRATVALPPFDNSAMDGYAVVSSSCQPGGTLRLAGEQPAGVDRQLSVRAGEAIRIFTGAPMPHGADAVVMQEDTEVTADGAQVVVKTTVPAGEFVRRRGGDVAEGQTILSAGQRITPGAIALLASQGLASVSVPGRPEVSILSTGDELAPPGAELRAGQIYDSNTPLLQALVSRCGGVVQSVQHCADDETATTAAVRRAIASDLLIITGGVSVGARDYVKAAITAAGGAIDVWRVQVKPGKPFLFGRAGKCAIFGLPGNPVSAFVTVLLFVRPAILRLMGASDEAAALPTLQAVAGEELTNRGDRPHYVRGSLRDGTFKPVGRQESHAVFGLSRADALLLVPSGAIIARGETASVLLFD